jgi:cell division protein FtsI/penicillin-binding protein 2
MAAFLAAGISQARVNLWQSESILTQAQASGRYLQTQVERAKRGSILSADGRVLAKDDESAVLNVGFRDVPQSPAFFNDLGRAAGLSGAELLQLAERGQTRRVWRQTLSVSRVAAIQQVKTDWRANGVSLDRTGRRTYELGEAGGSVVGMFRGQTGLYGLERSFDSKLRGRDGKTIGLVDRMGTFLPMRLDSETQSKQDGKNLVLTLDSELQAIATEAVRRSVEQNKAENGVAVVMDPATGDIMAMANWPTIDPNLADSEGRSSKVQTDFNPNFMARWEPGSTFKILSLAKAVDEGKFSMGSTLYCSGKLAIGRKAIHCDDHGGGARAHQTIGPVDAIAKSCNVSAATWAMRVGQTKFRKYLDDLGLLKKTELGLPNEKPGLFNDEEYNKPLQLANVGFGQSLNTTPVALCGAFAMIANQGVRQEPRLVKQIGRESVSLRPGRRIVSKMTAEAVMRAMEATIESDGGTGRKLRIPGYSLGGKTGTAQKTNANTGRIEGGGYISNFVGFVPAHQPKAVVLVMVNDPKAGKFYGSEVAGPVFLDIARAVIRRLQIPPTDAIEGVRQE